MMTAQPSAGSRRPNLAAELPARIDRIIGARYGTSVTEWAVVAATALKDQLTDNSGLPHRYITDHLALELGFEPREVEVIGDMLDVLQVSFDCADNIADREDDLLAGRSYAAAYESVPLAVLTYLPAILASHAVDLLYRNFSRPGFAPAYAGQRL